MATQIIQEHIYFGIWKFTFHKQLEKLYAGLNKCVETTERNGIHVIGRMTFLDFCIFVFEKFPEDIDYGQN